MWKRIHVRQLLAFFSLLGVMLYAIGGTFQYYFYSDDYSVLYHIQRNTSFKWPYNGEYFAVFQPLYHVFGTHPLGYFILGIVSYALATASVYLFFRTLTKSSFIAYMTSLIFSTGYVGVEQYNMMLVSITNNLSIIGIAGVLILYFLWLEQHRFRYYIISLSVYFLWLMLFPFRTFTLILFIPTLELFFGSSFRKPFQVRKIIYSLASLLPFYLIGRYAGVFGYGDNGNFGISKIIQYTRPAMLSEYFAILGRLVLPEQFLIFLRLPVVLQTYVYTGVFVSLLFGALGFILFLKNNKNKVGKFLLFILVLTLEAYAGFFLLIPSFGSGAPTNRYLAIAFLPFSSFLPILFWAIGDLINLQGNIGYKRLTILILASYCFIMMTFSHQYVMTRGRDQGPPSVHFYSQIKKAIPVMPDHLTVYIDSANYYPAIPRLGNILPRALFTPEVAFAVLYNVPINRITFTTSFDEYVKLLKQSNNPKGSFFSFYYDGKNLRDTTKEMQQKLESNQTNIVAQDVLEEVASNEKRSIDINVSNTSSLGKQQLKLTMKLSPLDVKEFTFPYFIGSPSAIRQKEIREYFDQQKVDRPSLFSYIIERQKYYKGVQITGTESHRDYPQLFMVDNRLDTAWVDAEHLWQLKPKFKPSFVLDLGMNKQISKIIWIPLKDREPSVYNIFSSTDKLNWHRVDVSSARIPLEDSFLVTDTFSPVWARYIRYEIDNTRNGQTPGIKELEVVEDVYNSIDPFIAWRIDHSPFEYIKNQQELIQSYDYIAKYGSIRIYTKTNKEDVLENQYFQTLPVFVDGQTHIYTISIPPRGTILEKIGIETPYPMKVFVEQIEIQQQELL